MEQQTKQCPSCGKDIRLSAVKCRHCGTWLEDNRIKPKPTQDPKKLKGEKMEKLLTWTLIALIVVLLVMAILKKTK